MYWYIYIVKTKITMTNRHMGISRGSIKNLPETLLNITAACYSCVQYKSAHQLGPYYGEARDSCGPISFMKENKSLFYERKKSVFSQTKKIHSFTKKKHESTPPHQLLLALAGHSGGGWLGTDVSALVLDDGPEVRVLHALVRRQTFLGGMGILDYFS